MKSRLLSFLSATTIIILASFTALSQTVSIAPFQNGSFEIPGESVIGLKTFLTNGDSRLTGWTVGGTGGSVALYNGSVPEEIFPAIDGNSHLLFNGGGGASGTWIAQTFETDAGGAYVVGFFIGRVGSGQGTLSITATARSQDGSVLATVQATPPTQGYGTIQILRFTASSAQTTVEFRDTSTGDISSQDITLDAVTVLPEPGLMIRVSSVEICWLSAQGATYQLQYRSAITGEQWLNLGEPVPGDGTRQCFTDPVAADSPKRFYRVVTTP